MRKDDRGNDNDVDFEGIRVGKEYFLYNNKKIPFLATFLKAFHYNGGLRSIFDN